MSTGPLALDRESCQSVDKALGGHILKMMRGEGQKSMCFSEFSAW